MMILRRWLAPCLASLVVIATASGCGGKRIYVPPRLDLSGYGQVALISFTIENARGSLHEFATERFAEAILDAQPGVEVLELGSADRLLEEGTEAELTPAAIRAIGAERGVPVVFAGHLEVSDVETTGGLEGFRSPHVEAAVSAELTVRLVSVESGGTLWRRSRAARETVAGVGLSEGVPYFTADDPDNAYGRLVDFLVGEVTRDLRPTWRRQ